MDAGGPMLYVLLVVLLIGGAYFASAETSYASVNKVRLKMRAEDGDKRARRALYISNNFDKALTTILIGNNIMHICCASIATLIATRLGGAGAVAYSTVVMTVIVFFFSEMLPKSYAKSHNESLSLSVSSSLYALMKVLTPITFIFRAISRLISKLFSSVDEPTVTEDELYDIIDTIEEEGAMDEDKSELIRSALEFDEITVQDVLTSRVDMAALDVESSTEEILSVIKEEKHSRFPVYQDTIDNIIGILQIRKYLRAYMKHDDIDVRQLMDKPHFVHMATNIDELLRMMSAQKIHMSIVTDEYGGTMGIVTMEDILEELVGEIWDEDDVVKEEFLDLGDGRYRVDSSMNCMNAFELIGFEDYEKDDFRHLNMGAWALEKFERFPGVGESFAFGPLEVRVSQVEGKRIMTLELTYTPEAQDVSDAKEARV